MGLQLRLVICSLLNLPLPCQFGAFQIFICRLCCGNTTINMGSVNSSLVRNSVD